MTDQEKIERIKQILGHWALDDSDCSGVEPCTQIMDLLDLDPYPRDPLAVISTEGQGVDLAAQMES
jgi:hypothetical protein